MGQLGHGRGETGWGQPMTRRGRGGAVTSVTRSGRGEDDGLRLGPIQLVGSVLLEKNSGEFAKAGKDSG